MIKIFEIQQVSSEYRQNGIYRIETDQKAYYMGQNHTGDRKFYLIDEKEVAIDSRFSSIIESLCADNWESHPDNVLGNWEEEGVNDVW